MKRSPEKPPSSPELPQPARRERALETSSALAREAERAAWDRSAEERWVRMVLSEGAREDLDAFGASGDLRGSHARDEPGRWGRRAKGRIAGRPGCWKAGVLGGGGTCTGHATVPCHPPAAESAVAPPERGRRPVGGPYGAPSGSVLPSLFRRGGTVRDRLRFGMLVAARAAPSTHYLRPVTLGVPESPAALRACEVARREGHRRPIAARCRGRPVGPRRVRAGRG